MGIFVLWIFSGPVLVLFVGGLLGILIYGLLAVAECLSFRDLISPLSYHFVWNTAALGIAPMFFATVVWNSGWTYFDQVSYVSSRDLAAGYLLCVSASFIIHATLRRVAPKRRDVHDVKRIIHPLAGIAIFVLGGVVIMAPLGEPILGGLAASLLRFSPLAILMAIALGSPKRKHYWPKLIFGTGLLLAANLLAYFPYKGAVFQSMFPLLIAMWKKSRLLATSAVLCVPLLYIGLVAPFVNASRSQAKVNPLERHFDESHSDDGNKFGQFMARVFMPIDSGYIVGQTRFHGFLGGESMKNVEYGLVPRFLWPDKPNMSSGKWFTQRLGSRFDTSTAMTPEGELYWNFSVFGVIFGMAGLACIYGLLWRLSEHFGKDSFLGGLLYVFAIIDTTNAGDASGTIIVLSTTLLLFLPAISWSKIKRATAWFFDPLLRPGRETLLYLSEHFESTAADDHL